MSYTVQAVGTKGEVERQVTQACDRNNSPEMPVVKSAMLAMIEAVEGDDKRVWIDATGYHSGGMVSHTWSIRTVVVPPES